MLRGWMEMHTRPSWSASRCQQPTDTRSPSICLPDGLRDSLYELSVHTDVLRMKAPGFEVESHPLYQKGNQFPSVAIPRTPVSDAHCTIDLPLSSSSFSSPLHFRFPPPTKTPPGSLHDADLSCKNNVRRRRDRISSRHLGIGRCRSHLNPEPGITVENSQARRLSKAVIASECSAMRPSPAGLHTR